MVDNIIALEERDGPFQDVFQRILRMVPDRDKEDKNLQRLLAFRLQVDGEAQTAEYLMSHIRDFIQCAYAGSLYTFLTTEKGMRDKACATAAQDPPPPDTA